MVSKAGIVAGRAFVILEALDMTGPALRAAERNIYMFGSRLQRIGTALFTRALTAALPGTISTRLFQQYDDIMRRVEARSGGTAQEMQALRDQTRKLGMASAFGARQIAALQDVLGQRKFNRKQILQMTEPITMLAKAAGEGEPSQDIQNAADLMSQAILMFNKDASEAGDIADMFTQAANESNFALTDLLIAISTAGPVAKQFNLSMEEMLATLMVMRDVGIDPSIAGTGLRNILLKPADLKAAENFNEELQRLTGHIIQFSDASGNLRKPAGILRAFEQVTKNLGTAEKGNLLRLLFGLRAITPATSVVNNIRAYDEALATLQKRAGVTKQAYDTMEGGIGGAFRRLINNAEELGLKLGETLGPTVTVYARNLRQAADSIGTFVKEHQDLVRVLNLAVVIIIPVAAGMFLLGQALKLVAYLLHPLVVLNSLFLNVLKLTGAAAVYLATLTIPILIRSLRLLWTAFRFGVTFLAAIGKSFVTLTFVIGRTISFNLSLMQLFGVTWAGIARTILGAAKAIAYGFATLAKTLHTVFLQMVARVAVPLINKFILMLYRLGLVSGMVARIIGISLLHAVSAIASRLFIILGTAIFAFFPPLISGVALALGVLMNAFSGFAKFVLALLDNITIAFVNGVTAAFSVAVQAVASFGLSLLAIIPTIILITSLITFLGGIAMSILTSIATVIKTGVMAAWSALVGFVQASTANLVANMTALLTQVFRISNAIQKAMMAGDTRLAIAIMVAAMESAWRHIFDYIMQGWAAVHQFLIKSFYTLKSELYKFLYEIADTVNRINFLLHPTVFDPAKTNVINKGDMFQALLQSRRDIGIAQKNAAWNDFTRRGQNAVKQVAADWKLAMLLQMAEFLPDPLRELAKANLTSAMPSGGPGGMPGEFEDIAPAAFGGTDAGKHIDAAEKGTSEAAKALYDNAENLRAQDNTQQQMLREQGETNDYLQSMDKNIRRLLSKNNLVGV
jgi:TP901 family phage tail tape measure protein